MIVAAVLAVSLVVVTFLFHYAVLRWLSGGMARIAMTSGVRILVIGQEVKEHRPLTKPPAVHAAANRREAARGPDA
jgi:hypothetical protein